MSEKDSSAGSSSQVPTKDKPVSFKLVGDTIKEALHDFKGFLDSSLNSLRQETSKKQENTEEQVLQIKRASELTLNLKGNKSQFDFNTGVLEKLERAEKSLDQGDSVSATPLVKEAVASYLKKRNKLIRNADKSAAGWAAVDEYLSDDLASESDDEKRIRQAQARAVRKKRANITNTAPAKRQRQGVAFPVDGHSTGSDLFRGLQYNRIHYAGYPANTSTRWGYGPKQTDICFNCGKTGHWRRGCAQQGFNDTKADNAGTSN
ncbi:LOW QUALITY PROTEIN: uncharacterized protein [Amphiura filiformis]|uniref:LOW QUALITY PROTEIN: uncharacterized protein n=1 Tax=Amphiura filiformis TaxID=82378 RepID=UPI003B22333B